VPEPAFQIPAQKPASAGSPSDAAWDAFFEGAGLSPDELRLAPDAMRRLGVLYRQTVLGLWDIIQDRASFKDEFRVERTQLSMGKNNPLKHLPPLEAAKILLGDIALPGFMDSEEALRTAFEDIKKHQLAMLAGVQQALIAVFDRLSPAEIEKMVEKAAGSRKGLSFGRGIDRWSVYQTLFEALRKDATSNANGVMSVAFREGYEKFLKSA
jgi:type VI secretion system FHA domain protein